MGVRFGITEPSSALLKILVQTADLEPVGLYIPQMVLVGVVDPLRLVGHSTMVVKLFQRVHPRHVDNN